MDFLKELIRKQPVKGGLLEVEIITLVYTFFTAAIIVLLHREMPAPGNLLAMRTFVILVTALLIWIYTRFPSQLTLTLRTIFPLTLLGTWYPDTFEFCRLFPYLDHYFAMADQWLFGYQPAAEFSASFPSIWASEILNMGYFSYFPLIVLGALLPLYNKGITLRKSSFILLCCFFLYYIIYLFLPVAGPQFYFPYLNPEIIQAGGPFPEAGNYFSEHSVLTVPEGNEGIFKTLVEVLHNSGERPTAAFPSSHVGIGTVLMLMFWSVRSRITWVALPFYVLLCLATVYIRAHYFVDVIGGLVTAPIFYFASLRLYEVLRKKTMRE